MINSLTLIDQLHIKIEEITALGLGYKEETKDLSQQVSDLTAEVTRLREDMKQIEFKVVRSREVSDNFAAQIIAFIAEALNKEG